VIEGRAIGVQESWRRAENRESLDGPIILTMAHLVGLYSAPLSHARERERDEGEKER
jgi:hypothetical protein